jgi:hypothetical protein
MNLPKGIPMLVGSYIQDLWPGRLTKSLKAQIIIGRNKLVLPGEYTLPNLLDIQSYRNIL